MIASKLILIPCIPKTTWGAVFVCRSNDFPRKAKALTIVSFFFPEFASCNKNLYIGITPRKVQGNNCGHTTDFYLGKTDLPRANSSKISRGKFISGFVLPR